MEFLVEFINSQVLWSALSIWLIFYILKAQNERDLIQAEREHRYQDIINNLTTALSDISDLKSDISELKKYLLK